MAYSNRRVFWYAGLMVVILSAVLYSSQLSLPAWLSVVGGALALLGMAGGLLALCRDWRPVALFGLGALLTFAPLGKLGYGTDTPSALTVVTVLALEMIAPILVLTGIGWCLYRAYRRS